MDNEVYSFALKSALNEIQKICPDITSAFLFGEDGEIIVGDEKTPEKTMISVVDAFDGVFEKADAIGKVEHITLEGSNGRVNISCVNDVYLVTVASKNADVNYVNTVVHVLIPTVLKLIEKISPIPLKSSETLLMPKNEPKPMVEPSEEIFEEHSETLEREIKPEPSAESSANQLIVENLGGLLVPSDTVRIDSEILGQWETIYEGRKIEEVEIETFDGKTVRCKVKPIKGSKSEGKGVIQMPEKVQLALDIRKGELVRVKPVIE